MVSSSRVAAWLLLLASPPLAATSASSLVDRFDLAVAGMSPTGGPTVVERSRPRRSGADFVVERRLNVKVAFPDSVSGTMYSGLLHGEAAVFTRSGNRLDAAVMREGTIEVTSLDAGSTIGAPDLPSRRSGRSVGPGHFENPAAYSLDIHFLKHDDLADLSIWDVHARYVAWWLADLSNHVLPTEPISVWYSAGVPSLTDMAYGGEGSLHAFERALKALDDDYQFGLERTYKKKYILLTANPPTPGTAGVAFEGGNEAMASLGGRERIIAHEIGHMLGANHLSAETRGWWGCETNMLSIANKLRHDCLEYTAANQRAIRSYMRHGPDTTAPRKMADAPTAE
jgi:hypothetical protein